MTSSLQGSGFSAISRFTAEIDAAAKDSSKLRPGYVLAGDELFLLDRCRAAVIKAFVPPDLRDFCLSDLDLASTSIFEILDRAQTPSLMSPFQVIFIRNVRQLYTRGAKKDEFAAIGHCHAGAINALVPQPSTFEFRGIEIDHHFLERFIQHFKINLQRKRGGAVKAGDIVAHI